MFEPALTKEVTTSPSVIARPPEILKAEYRDLRNHSEVLEPKITAFSCCLLILHRESEGRGISWWRASLFYVVGFPVTRLTLASGQIISNVLTFNF